MLRLIRSKKAQAAVEIAILSSIIILAFASLINLTERINRTIDHMNKVFQQRLAQAGKSGSSSSAINRYYRAPNIVDPYAPGELVFLDESGHVLQSGGKDYADVEITWEPDSALEDIQYTKKLIRSESKGGLPEARHRVTYTDPITHVTTTRGEYETP